MRMHRWMAGLFATMLVAPAVASAQDPPPPPVVYAYANRGVLGIRTEPVPPGSWNARQRAVIDVVKDSPAEKAGVMTGDTILSINGLAASAQVMSLPFEPGDTLTLRIRRNGRERDVTVVAGERAGNFTYRVFSSDSIRDAMTVILDRVRTQMDTLRFPHVEMRRFGDTASVIIIDGDTIRTMGSAVLRRFHPDSIAGGFTIRSGRFGDSTWVRMFGDSARGFHFDVRSDSVRWGRPLDVLAYTTTIGMRAVAGAELTELNPGLAEYFGATDGLLVLNAHEGTPAARAGLRAGDVIRQVDDTAVRSIVDLRRGIERARGRDVTLHVLRNGRNMELTLGRR
ncbi:MAG TPA: PDZ domain-containing protein [Longimicrobiales bacterium]